MATLTQPIKWHGGKHYLAKRIIALMPPHIHYVEPYFGGGSVLLEKDPEGISEVVNDLNESLSNFWRCLQQTESFAEFVRIVQAAPFSEIEWNEADGREHLGIVPMYRNAFDIDISAAVNFFIRCRQSFAGNFKSFAPQSRTRTRRGMNEQASAWIAAVDGLPAIHARLRRVVILCQEAMEVLRSQDGEQTLFYLDPPYLHETRTTKDAYAHEMSEDDHRALLSTLPSARGKWMLSGYRSQLYDEMLLDCRRYEFDLPNNAAGGETKRRMQECVWCNF